MIPLKVLVIDVRVANHEVGVMLLGMGSETIDVQRLCMYTIGHRHGRRRVCRGSIPILDLMAINLLVNF